jgi:hypothetical protein
MKKNNTTEWNKAIELLSNVAEYEASSIEYEVADTTTNSWEEFKEKCKKDGYITVSKDECDNSIYDSPIVNRMARVWHDKLHLNHNLSFSLEDEIKVAKYQQLDIDNYRMMHFSEYSQSVVDLAKKIIYIDVAEQLKYYYENNEYVENQKAFVLNIIYNK